MLRIYGILKFSTEAVGVIYNSCLLMNSNFKDKDIKMYLFIYLFINFARRGGKTSDRTISSNNETPCINEVTT